MKKRNLKLKKVEINILPNLETQRTLLLSKNSTYTVNENTGEIIYHKK